MPTTLTHAVSALGLGAMLVHPQVPRSVWVCGVALAVVPDLDVFGFQFGMGYKHLWGHRGLSHSLLFAGLLSTLAFLFIAKAYPEAKGRFHWLYFFLCAAFHGILDGLTNGGWGVGFFAPLDSTRYFFPVRPILVSPISLEGLLSDWGLAVLWNEFHWVWLPTLVAITVRMARLNAARQSMEKPHPAHDSGRSMTAPRLAGWKRLLFG